MHAFTPITHTFFHYSWFSIFLSFFILLLLLLLYCAHLWPFYTAYHDKIYHFYPFNPFWPIMGVLPRLPIGLPTTQPPPLYYVSCAKPHSQTKVVFFCFLLYFGVSIWIRVNPLSYQLLQHASNGFSSYLPLLDEMPSQQDISPNRT